MTSDLCKAGVMIEHEDAKNRSNEMAADTEHIMERVITANLPTKYGDFLIHGFENRLNGEHHVALTLGDVSNGEPVLVRVHSECLTGDVFGSAKCDCGDQFDAAMKVIAEEGRGIMIYLRQEGRGIGLINKLRAYSLQDQGMDTVEANVALGFPADMRDYTVGAEMLTSLGAKQLRLLTNNPDKVYSLEKFGLEIIERVPIETRHKSASDAYMKTKKAKMGHILKTY
ncbi:MAG: GTP cyclohydrolase II [Firmicutes bacterium]|nr:GTP cyclohydrolase II [Bacillota bacterium]